MTFSLQLTVGGVAMSSSQCSPAIMGTALFFMTQYALFIIHLWQGKAQGMQSSSAS